jgi:hypothetical protein
MDEVTAIAVKSLESLTDHAIQVVGSGIEISAYSFRVRQFRERNLAMR